MKYAAHALFAVAMLAGCGAGGDNAAKPVAATEAKQHDADDDGPGVTVAKEAQARAGIKVDELAAQDVRPELLAFGQLEEDPAESFVVRAAVAGTLRTSSDKAWPQLGQTIAAGAVLGRIEPRLAPTDRIGLNTQLATARAELNASGAAVAAAQKVYDRARALNADDKNISDKALQEAAAKLAAEKAHEAGVRATIDVLDGSVAGAAASGAQTVVAERGGEAVEVLAQPGETVEQGAALVRFARFDHLLARIDLSVGQHLAANAGAARIVPAGFEDRPGVPATRVGLAPVADPHVQGVSLLYRLSGAGPGVRPGMAVTAHFELPGTVGKGVLIPRAAIVQQDGRLWAYVQTKDDRFSRRAVPLDYPTDAGYLAAKGFAPGERIVITGAQTLLSEEFKSQNEADSN